MNWKQRLAEAIAAKRPPTESIASPLTGDRYFVRGIEADGAGELKWSEILPFVGTVNRAEFCGAGAGTLQLIGSVSRYDGHFLRFKQAEKPWNEIVSIRDSQGTPVYPETDFESIPCSM